MFNHLMWHESGWVLWVAVGTLIGLRSSYVMAWRIELDKHPNATSPHWWKEPGPFFLLLGGMCAWPLVLVAAALWPMLSAPPKEVRARDQRKQLEEENSRLDYQLEEATRELSAAKSELANWNEVG